MADVLPLSDGMFLRIAQEVADDFPFLEYDAWPVDHVALGLAQDVQLRPKTADQYRLRARAVAPPAVIDVALAAAAEPVPESVLTAGA